MAYPTNPIYKLTKDIISGEVNGVLKQLDTNVVMQIPFDADNLAYQKYLKWKAIDGNEPEAAD